MTLLGTILVYHLGRVVGSVDVFDDGSLEYDCSGIKNLVTSFAKAEGAEIDAAYILSLRYVLRGSWAVTWLPQAELWRIGRWPDQ